MYGHMPLREAVLKLAKQIPDPISSGFTLFADNLNEESQTVTIAWRKSIEEMRKWTELEEKELEILFQFGETLGKHDRDTQQKQIQLTLTHLEREELMALDKQSKYDKIDLIAAVVEAVSGQRFADFLQQRIFTPLGMVDTGFEVPAAKRHRVVDLPTTDADGRLVRADSPSARLPGVRLKAYDNAAGGLYSTAADYLAFARMLLGRAPQGQAPLLSRKTRELMMADQLGGAFAAPVAGFSRGEGFGLGGYVVTDPAVRGRLGSVGQFGWSGAAATYFTVDPAEDLIAIALLQYVDEGRGPRLPSVATPFYNLVYQAID